MCLTCQRKLLWFRLSIYTIPYRKLLRKQKNSLKMLYRLLINIIHLVDPKMKSQRAVWNLISSAVQKKHF